MAAVKVVIQVIEVVVLEQLIQVVVLAVNHILEDQYNLVVQG